jgi:hypothetical protein
MEEESDVTCRSVGSNVTGFQPLFPSMLTPQIDICQTADKSRGDE